MLAGFGCEGIIAGEGRRPPLRLPSPCGRAPPLPPRLSPGLPAERCPLVPPGRGPGLGRSLELLVENGLLATRRVPPGFGMLRGVTARWPPFSVFLRCAPGFGAPLGFGVAPGFGALPGFGAALGLGAAPGFGPGFAAVAGFFSTGFLAAEAGVAAGAFFSAALSSPPLAS